MVRVYRQPRASKVLSPLRRIVEWWTDPTDMLNYERLECGHVQRQKSYIYGPTNAYRRRCKACLIVSKEEPEG